MLKALRLASLTGLIVACSRTAGPPATSAPAPLPSTSPTAPAVSPTAPDTSATPAPPLPPIPLVDGPLAIRVQYPPPNIPVPRTPRDSNFILGSLGNGRATLTINGAPVRVYPNGAFMGWVANPRGATPAYELVARVDTTTVRLVHAMRAPTPATPIATTGRLIVDSSEFASRANYLLRDDETVSMGLRVPSNARVVLIRGRDTTNVAVSGERASFGASARFLRDSAIALVIRGRDTVRVRVPAIAGPADDRPRWVTLGNNVAQNDSDAVVYGRPLANDAYKWFFLPGTDVVMTGRQGGFTRIRLDAALEVWVPDADVNMSGDNVMPMSSVRTANARVRTTTESADLVIPMNRRPTYFVEEKPGVMELTLYDTRGNSDIISMPTNDSLVRHVTWEQVAEDRVKYTLHLHRPSLGYHVLWDRNALVLRVRRPPTVDPRRPLQGLTIALDPGHPPAGSTGPTHLYEGQAVLWVAEHAKRMLEEQGARVVMTRTTMDTVQLHPRRQLARRANAHAFVSIHLNAYPDGVNPFQAPNGTGTYFYRTHAEPLARATQQGMLRHMGLHDEGIFFRSLAVVVQTWMPAILTEGAFVIIPEQEAAMRTREFQERYARGIVDGLTAYFRNLSK